MSQVKYLIIGGSHAGLCALEVIRFQDEDGQIAMVSREQSLPYSPTILPYVISGKKQTDTILLRDESYFADLNVRFMPGSTVVAVNPAEATVALQSGETIRYEKLLLATGADAAVPPFPGIDTVSYQVVRTLDDALKLRRSIQNAKSAVVIGAGLIAMHTAENLARAGLEVTMVVRRQVSLFAYFDGDAARMIETIFSKNGVRIATGSGVAGIAPEGDGCEVKLESGEALSADLLLLAAGVRPRAGFLEGSGIDIDQGILVNESMRTNVDNIWAAGDVAQAPGFFDDGKTINATLPNASVQGRIAGMDMVGDPALKPYPGSSGLNTFNFFDNHGFSVGLATVTETTDNIEVNTIYLPSSRQYQKLVFKNDRLIGVSAINAELDPGVLRELIQREINLAEIKDRFTSDPLNTGRLLMTKLWR
ncbi:MAG: FAD-dependent oxidoreductase [Desulfobacterales bacterium]|jgi:phenylglyoxylate dehydrogenase epsilon subunit